jgi:hypothetical protein
MLNAWFRDSDGFEIGDICNFDYGAWKLRALCWLLERL